MTPIPQAAIDAATLALHESICEGPLESCPLAPEHAEFATRMLFAAEEAWPHQPPKRDLTGTTNGQFDRGPVASPYRRHARPQQPKVPFGFGPPEAGTGC